ncbi:Glutamine--fructose-6-phosphate aminotransferase [isomerizing] [Candidatus Profftia lariciata]|uniref:glutamine--fructose-6-phosphate transaminase (isomerizing) n=1 Tax=Candidatus Profftia lariciata TaxID=1987921 RepID=UPI001D008134|nr:glutamine--fructose-6-phosphate transaminase (isomerizing) [Candidatus Profftia lariciata]UDG81376.1 Glutamine--fructose-6-phosphate aminotransferase [isomerizing] [Candidatus Profftia lariciata]
MCGIIGAIAQHNIAGILLEGLHRLEYRGYDSAGLAIIDDQGHVQRIRRVGKVKALHEAVAHQPMIGKIGIAQTRWATHGEPTEQNAHPHISEHIAVVHNGIIENYQFIRALLIKRGYCFTSETDTEVIAHLTHWEQQQSGGSLLEVVQRVIPQLSGAYGAVIMDACHPDVLITARSGSPLVIGCGLEKNFIASDQLALISVTNHFIFLEEGDIAEVTRHKVDIFDKNKNSVKREVIKLQLKYDNGDKGTFCHYMQKEIYEQPIAITNTFKNRFKYDSIYFSELSNADNVLLSQVEHIQIIACGTSYHAGMVARYWFESLSMIPCDVEISSEFRYRKSVVRKNSLIITLSQSGETADTIAALRLSKKNGYLGSLAICNVANASLLRESDLAIMTKAGIEIGVASTKAFTTQLTLLLMLVVNIGRLHHMHVRVEQKIIKALKVLPTRIEQILSITKDIENLAKDFIDKQHVLFLGRGDHYPIAMEGALKLKEISYIHAEAYAAGELKHGPLALIDSNIPVVVIAPNNHLLAKLKSNIEEVRARNGLLYVFTNIDTGFTNTDRVKIIFLPQIENIISPILYTVPLQLLAYNIALMKGTDIDQPRNLAKSVTVE